MKVLIVDDEAGIRNVIKEYCLFDNYEVTEACDGQEAISILQIQNDIDIIILDIMMPKMDGYSTLKEIRKFSKVPVIMLSARSEEYNKLLSFELGVDDYVTKPFSPKELLARIKAIINRGVSNDCDKYIYKTLEIDYLGHKVMIDNEEVRLTPKEYELLTLFVHNKSIALSRETLLSKVWGYDFYGDDRTIDTHIKMLRNNLGKYRNLIVTVRGMGYKFEEE